MSFYANLNGERVITASISIPYYGLWVADVTLAVSGNVPQNCILTVGDLVLVGYVYRMASFSGSRSARIVGGFGGWRQTLPARQYQNTGGILVSTVLNDAALETGEQVVVLNDGYVGTNWVREQALAQQLLRQLGGSLWYVSTTGITQVGVPRLTNPITSQFDVGTWNGGKNKFTIASETLSDWMPGRTFVAPTVTTPQSISLSRFDMDNDGVLRIEVLTN